MIVCDQYIVKIALVLMLFGLLSCPLQAATPWAIHDLAVLTAAQGSDTIASVTDPQRAAEFIPKPRGFSAGYNRNVYWLRFTLHPPPPDAHGQREALLVIYPPFLDDLQLYLPHPDHPDGFERRRSGDHLPFTAREYPYRSFVHHLVFADDQPIIAYLRLQTTSSAWVVLDVLSMEKLTLRIAGETLLLGLSFGLLLAGIFANLWHGLWLQQALYRSFLLYLCAALLMVFAINGFLAQFVLPQHPLIADYVTSISNLLVVAAMTRFFTHALALKTAARWLRWIYHAAFALALVLLPSPFLDLYTEGMQVLIVVALPILIPGALRSLLLWWRGKGEGSLLFLAHLFSLIGGLSSTLVLMGWLPGNLLLHSGFQIGLLGSLIALQVMLAQRVRHIERTHTQTLLLAEHAQAKAQIEHAHLEQQRQLMSMLTHELKTLLAVIRLRLGAKKPSAHMQHQAQDAVTDILAILERCTMSNRLDDQAVAVEVRACDLEQVISELVAARFTDRVQWQQQRMTTYPINTDDTLLRVIVANLLDNAVKYSPPATPIQIQIEDAPQKTLDGWCLMITNTRLCGDELNPNRVFEKYYRAPSAHRHSGSGLGLYIVHELVAQLQGQIDCRCDSDQVCFELWLPKNI